MTRSELIAKAIQCVQENSRLTLTGERHFRETAVVYLAAEASGGSKACIEVLVDAKSGEFLSFSVIPDASVLHAYSPENRPDKPEPN